MFQVNHNYILDVIESCIDREHTTTCYSWIKDMYNKSILEFEEFSEYAEIIYEKDIVLGSRNDSIECVEYGCNWRVK